MFVNLGQEATLIDFPRRRSGKVAIANRFIDSDIVISVAKLKTSCFMMISGAVKNFYGSIPGTQKALIHNEFPDRDDFADMLIDLAAVPKKSMALIDGGLIMHGNGPVHGKVREENIYILSDDIFAADFVMAKLLGFKEREVPVLKRAMERGLLHPEGIEIFSDITMPMAAIEIPVTLQSYLNCTTAESDRRVQHIASIRVEIDEDKCECCGHCASVCPTHSIDLDDVFPRINYETCINCFCCNELCPVGAPHPAEDIGRLWKGVMKNEG
jgi:ferredoxin